MDSDSDQSAWVRIHRKLIKEYAELEKKIVSSEQFKDLIEDHRLMKKSLRELSQSLSSRLQSFKVLE